jgi:hypothetical protein
MSLPGMYLICFFYHSHIQLWLCRLTFNADRAFVGTLTKTINLCAVDGKIDNQNLMHSSFLAVSLLLFGKRT